MTIKGLVNAEEAAKKASECAKLVSDKLREAAEKLIENVILPNINDAIVNGEYLTELEIKKEKHVWTALDILKTEYDYRISTVAFKSEHTVKIAICWAPSKS